MNNDTKTAFSVASALILVGLLGITMVFICPDGLSRDQMFGITVCFIIFDVGIGCFIALSIYSWLNHKFPEIK